MDRSEQQVNGITKALEHNCLDDEWCYDRKSSSGYRSSMAEGYYMDRHDAMSVGSGC